MQGGALHHRALCVNFWIQSLPGSIFFAVKAWSYYLDRFLLLYGDNGVVVGASYTDLTIGLPVLWVLVGLSFVASVAALANLSGIATTPQGTYSAEQLSQSELHWGLRRLFELLAASRPTVLLVEDLHWAETTLLELLRYIGESDASLNAGSGLYQGNDVKYSRRSASLNVRPCRA